MPLSGRSLSPVLGKLGLCHWSSSRPGGPQMEILGTAPRLPKPQLAKFAFESLPTAIGLLPLGLEEDWRSSLCPQRTRKHPCGCPTPAASLTCSSPQRALLRKFRLVGCQSITLCLNFFQLSEFYREMTFVPLSTKY